MMVTRMMVDMKHSKEWASLDDNYLAIIKKYQREVPVKLGAIAGELGLSVKVSTLSSGVSGEIKKVKSGYEVRVNKHEIKERQRFTLAHEISHYLLHEDLIGDGISDTILYRSSLSDTLEAQANRLAADILMPVDIVAAKLVEYSSESEVQRYEKIAKDLCVSTSALKIRLGKL